MAHPAFTARFKADLVRPGLRVPLTADKALFDEAVALGREVVWLHCYGERFVDPAAGRPKGPPRLPAADRPTIPADGAIPGAPAPLPQTMSYDAAKRRLVISKGFVENVAPAMRNYEISGKNVLDQWFSYRRRDRTKPLIGDKRPPSPLEKIQPDGWLAEYTEDLLNLLNVLGRLVALEPHQADLLDRIVAGPLSRRRWPNRSRGQRMRSPRNSAPSSGKLSDRIRSRDEDEPPMTRQLDLFGEDRASAFPVVERAGRPSIAPIPTKCARNSCACLRRRGRRRRFPWDTRRTLYWRTVFPQMTNWLPGEEGAQLRFEFELEIRRLKRPSALTQTEDTGI